MAKKEKLPVRTCAECIHEYQCQMWNMGTIHNMDATTCNGYETVKDSAAYLCGVLDERKRKRTNSDRIRAMSDEELIKLFDLEMQTCPPDAEEDRWCDMDDDCKRCWLEWLCKPVKEDA